jgi:beta-N-acetylhexosaminidase
LAHGVRPILPMTARAFITGLAGVNLREAERAFLREAQPWGAILFRRNVDSPEQVRRLTASVRAELGWNAPILVDQEGGRVQRLGPPHWPSYPAGAAYGRLYAHSAVRGERAAFLAGATIAADLIAVGIDVDCAPIADVPIPGSHGIIGDRAYGNTSETVAAVSRAFADGLLSAGVLPVLKHLPGHGRATADSHHELPKVDAELTKLRASDFAAFRSLSDLPLGMTAHVVYTAVDPIAPATTSVTVISQVIRGWIGFGGLLMSDDISMGALSGSIAARSRAAIAAGCDLVLHCNGELAEMHEVAGAVPMLARKAATRAEIALALRGAKTADVAALRAEFDDLLRATSTVETASL